MSQSITEMLASWEKSREKPASTPLPPRFYDERKRPTGKPRITGHGMTPQGEALYCENMGLGNEIAKPMTPKLK